jgi:hypothetical protein
MADRAPQPVPPRDPRGDVCPDYTKLRYTELVESAMAERKDAAGAVTRAARTRDEAITHLQALWREENKENTQEWAEWVATEKAARDAEMEAENERAEKAAQELVDEREKKRVKIPPPVAGARPTGAKALVPHKYTYNALVNRTHFSLWYLTVVGLASVADSSKHRKGTTISEEGQTLDLGSGATLTLPSSNAAPAREAVDDRHLLWSDITFAFNNWIYWMQRLSYEENHIKAWMNCLIMLQSSTKWRNMLKLGDAIIIRYIDETRFDWYQAIKGYSVMFDPAELDEVRLNEICDDLLRERRAGVTDTVRISF